MRTSIDLPEDVDQLIQAERDNYRKLYGFAPSRSAMIVMACRNHLEKKPEPQNKTFLFSTDASLQCTLVSEPWQEITGQTPQQSLGDGWSVCIHPQDLGIVRGIFEQATANKLSYWMECRVKRKDGSYTWVHSDGVPNYSADGEFLGYVGTGQEIFDEALKTARGGVEAAPVRLTKGAG